MIKNSRNKSLFYFSISNFFIGARLRSSDMTSHITVTIVTKHDNSATFIIVTLSYNKEKVLEGFRIDDIIVA